MTNEFTDQGVANNFVTVSGTHDPIDSQLYIQPAEFQVSGYLDFPPTSTYTYSYLGTSGAIYWCQDCQSLTFPGHICQNKTIKDLGIVCEGDLTLKASTGELSVADTILKIIERLEAAEIQNRKLFKEVKTLKRNIKDINNPQLRLFPVDRGGDSEVD